MAAAVLAVGADLPILDARGRDRSRTGAVQMNRPVAGAAVPDSSALVGFTSWAPRLIPSLKVCLLLRLRASLPMSFAAIGGS